MLRLDVRPELLRWARERAGIPADAKRLTRRFPRYPHWEQGEVRPTLRQLEEFARVTRTPFGFLLLRQPPEEPFPIPDLRGADTKEPTSPSLNLRDTVYLCERRQESFRDYAAAERLDPVSIAGCATLEDSAEAAAARARSRLKMELQDRAGTPTWHDALPQFIKNIEAEGVLVMVSGVVGNNTHRSLDPNEFRGFALVDEIAPIVFINGTGAPAVQMFTLAHELAHVYLGESALSNIEPTSTPFNAVEAWCDKFAVEVLVPIEGFREEYRGEVLAPSELKRLSQRFKVSTLMILRRLYDLGVLARDQFQAAYGEELDRSKGRGLGSGGDFYTTLGYRVGDRFGRALVTSTLEGKTLYRDALRLLGVKRTSTFQKFTNRLGIN